MSIEKRLVVEGYRALLDREPESDAILEAHAQSASSFEQLLLSLAKSDEYKNKVFMQRLRSALYSPPQAVDVTVSNEELALLMGRVKREWKKLGEDDPYWSVLSEERYRSKRLSEQEIAEFLSSGRDSAGLIDLFEARSRSTINRGTCFELGCGVGRVTCHLSKMFQRVIAADISPGNIELCRNNLAASGISNVECLLIDELDDYKSLPQFDFMFSVIVLQHNTPPVQKFILDCLLRKIRGGGGCLFQSPSELPSYSFDVAKYLATDDELIEMHALPMSFVLAALQKHHLQIVQVFPDSWTGSLGSFTYFAIKLDNQVI
jgi:2-polyprenyl-3-methyl-5-hydroxy-6-metoxy-1,4-benzoquinol methylase